MDNQPNPNIVNFVIFIIWLAFGLLCMWLFPDTM